MADMFAGFTPELVTFLGALRDNNRREWFAENKATYERVMKTPAQLFCNAMAEELEAMTGQSHSAKIFRIHRDLRFAKDKTPYNTHLHISFIPEIQMSSPPCWFFGLDPERLSLGAGLFAFDKAMLDLFRQMVAGTDGAKLEKLLGKLESDGQRLGEPDLKRVPAGYGQDHPRADLLKFRGLSAWLDFEDTAPAIGPDGVAVCLTGFKRLRPLFDWLLSVR